MIFAPLTTLISDHNCHLLIEVPVVRWEESSLLLGMEEFASPLDLIRWQEKLINNKKMRRRREFVEHWLLKAERQGLPRVGQCRYR